MNQFIRTYKSEIFWAFFCLILGLLSGFAIEPNAYLWYETIQKPLFNPPNWIFGPVWSILYLMMGAALGKIMKAPSENKGLVILFVVQFALNLVWTPLFFYLHRIDLALYDLCLLWLSLCFWMALTRNNRVLFLLFLPYFLWVSFAFFLNWNLYQLNLPHQM